MPTRATANRGAQAAIGDIRNHTVNAFIGELSGHGNVIIQNLHINAWPERTREPEGYAEVMAIVLPILNSQPGVLQSVLSKNLPEIDAERFRYVMYYGELIGDIHRVKNGRSYSLFATKTT